MKTIPPIVCAAWEQREERMVLSTAARDGMPNAIWVICAKRVDDRRIVISDNFMNKTRANIQVGSRGALLFIAPERKAYQLKGRLIYHIDGPIYEDMKSNWLNPKFAGNAAVELIVDEAYCGAEKLL